MRPQHSHSLSDGSAFAAGAVSRCLVSSATLRILGGGSGLRQLTSTGKGGIGVFVAEGDALLPSGRSVAEVGLANCEACVANTVAVARNLQGEAVTARSVVAKLPPGSELGDALSAVARSTKLTDVRSAGSLEEAADVLSDFPGAVGVAEMWVTPGGGADSTRHVANFVVDSGGNLVFVDATGELAAAGTADALGTLSNFSLFFRK